MAISGLRRTRRADIASLVRPDQPCEPAVRSDTAQERPMALSLPKQKIRLLLLEGVNDSAVRLFEANGYAEIERLPKALDADALKRALAGVHMLGIRSRTQLTAEVLAAADRLMVVGCFSVGTN